MTLQKTAPKRPDGSLSPDGPLRLVLITPRGVVARALPRAGRVTLGRAPEADVTVDDPEMSRLHAAIFVGPSLRLRDLGSSNGTRLDGRALGPDEDAPLPLGSAFEVGSTLAVVQPAAPSSSDPETPEAVRDVAPPESGMRARVVVIDPAMSALHRMVERVAVGEISVLLLGETGVGKEVFAERVHQLSPRARGPFVRLNCAALTESLLESELFGHEKGAFTGAVSARVGLLESAAGGTVFLDEVGELPASVQVRLLRVLEERKVLPVGARQPRPIDVRVVSATHRDLESEITAGRFRMDLWFRLNGVSLVVPPLRERVTEIDALATLFLGEACARSRIVTAPRFSPEALAALKRWRWPGNLRELRNVTERAALLATDGVITEEHLPDAMRAATVSTATVATAPPPAMATPSAEPQSMREKLEAMERQRMMEALTECGGNQTRAAAQLGMPRRTFVFKLARYGIARPRKPDEA
jgi:transcriptional regulator with GAF, ATPase, and Fis domain